MDQSPAWLERLAWIAPPQRQGYPVRMTIDDPQCPTIRPIDPKDEDQALALLVAPAATEDRAMRLETMRADLRDGEPASAILLGAYRGGWLVGAVFSQLQAGRSGVVGLPGAFAGEPRGTLRSLLAAAAERLAGQGARLIYAILEHPAEAEVDLLRQTGFHHLAHLLYLVAPDSEFPPVRPESPLDFEPYCPASHRRLASVVETSCQFTNLPCENKFLNTPNCSLFQISCQR